MKISINKILENIPKDLTDIEKARYIYLQIGNINSYNREFLYITDSRFITDAYRERITHEMIEEGNYENKIVSLCKQISEIECEAINKIGKMNIQAVTVGYNEEEEGHVAVILNISNKNYYLDINPDLYKIQKGMKTVGFAKTETAPNGVKCEVISDEEIKKMDEKIGYCKYGMYMDDIIEMIKNNMENKENWEKYTNQYDKLDEETKEDVIYRCKIDFVFKYLKNNLSEKDKLYPYELNKYYKKVLGTLLTDKEKEDNTIRELDIFLLENKQKKESFIYEIEMKNRTLYYVYNDDEREMKQVSEKELKEMGDKGYIEYLSDYYRPKFVKDKER